MPPIVAGFPEHVANEQADMAHEFVRRRLVTDHDAPLGVVPDHVPPRQRLYDLVRPYEVEQPFRRFP
jgi:hypothetical protein